MKITPNGIISSEVEILFNLHFTPTTWLCMWVLDVYEETQLLWHLMVKLNLHPNGLGVPHEGCHLTDDWQ